MNKISSSDKAALVRLAHSLPAGDPLRKSVLAGLKVAEVEVVATDRAAYSRSFKEAIDLARKLEGVLSSLNASGPPDEFEGMEYNQLLDAVDKARIDAESLRNALTRVARIARI